MNVKPAKKSKKEKPFQSNAGKCSILESKWREQFKKEYLAVSKTAYCSGKLKNKIWTLNLKIQMLCGDLAKANFSKGHEGIRPNGLMINGLSMAVNVRALAIGWKEGG